MQENTPANYPTYSRTCQSPLLVSNSMGKEVGRYQFTTQLSTNETQIGILWPEILSLFYMP